MNSKRSSQRQRASSNGLSLLSVQWLQKGESSSMPTFTRTESRVQLPIRKSFKVTRRHRPYSNWIMGLNRPKSIAKSTFFNDLFSLSKKVASLHKGMSGTSHLNENDSDGFINDFFYKKGRHDVSFFRAAESKHKEGYNNVEWFKSFDGFTSITRRNNLFSCYKMCITYGIEKEDFSRIMRLFLNHVSVTLPNLFSGSIGQQKNNMKLIKDCQTMCCTSQGFYRAFSTIPIVSPRLTYTGGLLNTRSAHINIEKNANVYITSNREFAQRVTKSVIYMNIKSYLTKLKVGDVLRTETGIRFKINKIENNIFYCKVAVEGILYSYTRVYLPRHFNDIESTITDEEMEDLIYLRNIATSSVVLPFVCDNYREYYNSIIETLKTITFPKSLLLVSITLQKFEELYTDNKCILHWLVDNFHGIIIKIYDRLPLKKSIINLTKESKQLFEKFHALRKPIIISDFFTHCSQEINQELIVDPDSHKYIYYYPDKYLLTENQHDPVHIKAFHEIIQDHSTSIQDYAMEVIKKDSTSVAKIFTLSENFARSIVEFSYYNKASVIILISKSGRMASKISHYRPNCPIIVLLDNPKLVKFYGVYHNVRVAHYTQAYCKGIDFLTITLKKIIFGLLYGLIYGIVTPKSNIICVYRPKKDSPFPNKIATFVAEQDVLKKIYEVVLKDHISYSHVLNAMKCFNKS